MESKNQRGKNLFIYLICKLNTIFMFQCIFYIIYNMQPNFNFTHTRLQCQRKLNPSRAFDKLSV